MLDEPGADKFRLVHGVVGGIRHAWIEMPDGQIYDPVNNNMPRHWYVAEKRYTRKQMARAMLKHNHHGPWH